jgi:glycosyltransferase involved in cell wall biosynthesis
MDLAFAGDGSPQPPLRPPRMRILVWQWGRHGAGPLLAVHVADALRSIPGTEVLLSLSRSAEILRIEAPPHCDLPVDTYGGMVSLVWRLLQAPWVVTGLVRRIGALRPDIAICAMPGPLDLLQLAALRRLHIPIVILAHDADPHPCDRYPLLMALQRRLLRRADAVVALTRHVASRLVEQGAVDRQKVFVLWLPPLVFGALPPPPGAHGGPLRLLFFGRLLSYKGLNLLQEAVRELGLPGSWVLRVVGAGPESSELAALRATAGVTVENRWVPEGEIGDLLAWADVVVLPYIEASQSGVAPAAIAAGRVVVATRVGGLLEQLGNESLARLCEPHPASLAMVLRELLHELPKPTLPRPPDPHHEWHEFASQLLDRVAQPVLGGNPGTVAEAFLDTR